MKLKRWSNKRNFGLFHSALTIKLLRWAGIASLSQRQARNGRASLTVNEGSACGSADELSCLRDLESLRLWLTNDRLTDFFGLDDAARLAHNFRVSDDFLDVNDLRLGHDALLVDDARLADLLRLIDQSRLADFLCLRHDMFVDHSALGVDDFLLAHNSRWLLNLHELRSALLWRANLRALWHRAEFLSCVAFRVALREKSKKISLMKFAIQFLSSLPTYFVFIAWN